MGGGASTALEVEPVAVPTISKQGVTLALLKRLEQLSIDHNWTTTSAVISGFVLPATEAMRVARIAQLKAAEAAKVKGKQGGNKGKQTAVVEVVEMSCCSIEGMMKDHHTNAPHPTINLTYSQCFTPSATVFVSHSRDQPFATLVSTLESFVAQQEAKKPGRLWSFWIDFLVSDERENKAAYPIEWYTDAYPSHIATIGRTLVVVSPGHKPAALTNLGCLYEMFMSLKPPITTTTATLTPPTATATAAATAATAGSIRTAGSGKAGKLYFQLCSAEREAFVRALEEDFAGLLEGWGGVDMRNGLAAEGAGAGTGAGSEASPTQSSLLHHAIDWPTHEHTFYSTRIASIESLGKKARRNDLTELARLRPLLAEVQERLKDGDGYTVGNELIRGKALGVVADTLQGLVEGAMVDGVGEVEREKATRTMETALATYEQHLGPEHPHTLATAHHLARLLSLRPDSAYCMKRARRFSEQALQGREKVLGATHPETLSTVDHLSVVMTITGRLKDAKKLSERAIEGRERILKPDHPDTLTSVYNHGVVLWKQGKWDEAKWMYLRALAGRETHLGQTHPDTLQVCHALGVVYKQLDKWKEAKKYFEMCLDGRVKVLRDEHPDTLDTYNMLGQVLMDQNMLNEAKSCFEKAFSGREKILGKDHVDTLKTAYLLAIVLLKQYQRAQAKSLFQRCFDGFRRVYGESHPETTDAQRQLDGLAGF